MKSYYNATVKVISLCIRYYKPKTFEHCLRVANYAVENNCLVTDEQRQIAFIMAMCHDLLEDTQVSIEEICEATGFIESFVREVLGALTKEKDETYIEYINRLKASRSKYPYIVKLADMKDHLMQKDTLTERLKDKYWEAIPYLL